MSQYGAYGFAEHGAGYAEILSHYYTGTALGAAESGRSVRVLLQSGHTSASFSGATRAGSRTLDRAKSYRVTPPRHRAGRPAGPLGQAAGHVRLPAAGGGPVDAEAVRLAGGAINGRTAAPTAACWSSARARSG